MCGITISPPPANAASKLDLTGGTMTGQLVLQLASATGAVNVSPTWNNGAVSFVGIYGRVTNTASGASSKLIDLGTASGGSLFDVDKTGAIHTSGIYQPGGSTYGFDNSSGWGMGWKSNGDTVAVVNSNVGQKQFSVAITGAIGISGALFPFPDTTLFRTAEGRLALRNQTGYIGTLYPTQPQAFEVYNTYTDATDYERAVIDWQTESNVLRIGTEKGASGGSARGIKFSVDGVVKLEIGTDGEVFFTPPTTNPGPGILWNSGGTPAIGT